MKKLKFSEVLEELQKSHEFKKFEKENKKAELVAGFFVFDFESKTVNQQVDFATNDKLFTFHLNFDGKESVKVKEEDKVEKDLPEIKLPKELKIDLHNLKDVVENEIELKQINQKINKIIAVLQIHDDVLKWNLTCMLSGLKMLRLHVDAQNGNFLFSQVSSILDFVKKV
ncbi:hypothetical protein HZA33_04460 [Candidatus Pacearchaeota archaeon]|nr:hypothetical protein [Candidatus Pacearchaeota archaeon]